MINHLLISAAEARTKVSNNMTHDETFVDCRTCFLARPMSFVLDDVRLK
jgi:hypothetical protein